MGGSIKFGGMPVSGQQMTVPEGGPPYCRRAGCGSALTVSTAILIKDEHMNLKSCRRSFLSWLGTVSAGMLGSSRLNASVPTVSNVGSMSSLGLPLVDGHAVAPITKGFCSTGNPWEML